MKSPIGFTLMNCKLLMQKKKFNMELKVKKLFNLNDEMHFFFENYGHFNSKNKFLSFIM